MIDNNIGTFIDDIFEYYIIANYAGLMLGDGILLTNDNNIDLSVSQVRIFNKFFQVDLFSR